MIVNFVKDGLYLNSGLSGYNVVYGSLGTLVATMTWFYLVGLIMLFGGYISAETAERHIWRA